MPTYSTNLAINLPNDGEYSGTWGQITNNNLGTLIEQSISGYVQQGITDGADTAITIPLGATGVARNMYIEATGNITAQRNLVVPNNNKLYFVFNNTTGGNNLQVKTSGGTGVPIPPGRKAALVVDLNHNVVAANDYFASIALGTVTATGITLTGNMTISGTLITTGMLTAGGFTATGTSIPVNGMYLPNANTLGLSTNSIQRVTVTSTGVLNIVAPTSGNALTVAVTGGFYGAAFTIGAAGNCYIGLAGNANSIGTTDVVVGQTGASQGILLNRANASFIIGTNNVNGMLTISATGVHTFAAPSGAGPTMQVVAAAANTTNVIQFPTAGSMINFARLGDGSLTGFVGSRTSGNMNLYNSGGVSSEVELTGGVINFYTNTVLHGSIASNGACTLWEGVYNIGTAGLFPAATNENGSFTGTLTGCTSGSITGTIKYTRNGSVATLTLTANMTGTSNATTCTITGLPAGLTPISGVRCPVMVIDAGAWQIGTATVGGTTITLVKGDNTPFTNTGTKGLANFTISYSIT